jgi:nickel transport protein
LIELIDHYNGDNMKRSTKLLAAALAVAGTIAASTTQAHGIWFAQRATQLAMIYGVGADDLDAVKRLPLVTSIGAYDSAGETVPTRLEVAGPLLLVDTTEQPAIVAAVLNNGIWSKTPDGKWHKKGKDEVPDAVVAERTYKYGVHLRAPLKGAVPLLPAQRLQIVPVNMPIPQAMGEPLKLRVLFDGKPVAGASVLHDLVNDPDGEPAKTAADGTVTIKVRNQGMNVIAAVFEGPSEEPAKTLRTEHLATLSFVLPHLPE